MPIRSMTGFAQVSGQVNDHLGFTLSLKSVNHRFLDLHLRMPPDSDALEMKLRRALKDRLARGHVELTLSIQALGADGIALNRDLVRGYIEAFRSAAKEFGVSGEPDINNALRLPGALQAQSLPEDDTLHAAVLEQLERAIQHLNAMRVEEGRGIDRELRERIGRLTHATAELEKMRTRVVRAYVEKITSRMQELIGSHADADRILQEAAILADRSDIQEELARMQTHAQHFLGMLDATGEVGKKLDFLLQEMAREGNTLLSKTSGIAGEGLRITETGLAMKAEIEKLREQVQNIE